MSTLEDKVRSCYETKPFPNILQRSADKKAALMRLSLWKRMQLESVGIEIENLSPDTILCAGCGTGEEPLQLSGFFPNSKIHAIDMSKPSLDIAKKNVLEFDVTNIIFEQASILKDLPNYTDKYDAVFSTGVIHCLEDPEKGFSNVADRLNSDGVMIIMLYHKYGLLIHRLRLKILDVVAGQEFEKRKKWALKLRFHDGRNETHLYDLFVNPQVKTYSIQEIKKWGQNNNLRLVGVSPPLKMSRLVDYAAKGESFMQKKRNILVLKLLRYFFGKKDLEEVAIDISNFSNLHLNLFQIVFFCAGLSECYYAFERKNVE